MSIFAWLRKRWVTAPRQTRSLIETPVADRCAEACPVLTDGTAPSRLCSAFGVPEWTWREVVDHLGAQPLETLRSMRDLGLTTEEISRYFRVDRRMITALMDCALTEPTAVPEPARTGRDRAKELCTVF